MLEVGKSSCNGHDFIYLSSKNDILLFIFLAPGAHTLVAREHGRKGEEGTRKEDLFIGSLVVTTSSVKKHCFWTIHNESTSRTFSTVFRWHDISLFGWTPFFGYLCPGFLAGNLHGWVRKGTPPIPKSKEAFRATDFNKKSPCLPFL